MTNQLKQGKKVFFECPNCQVKLAQYRPHTITLQGQERMVWIEQRKCPECGGGMVKHVEKVRYPKHKKEKGA